MEKMIQILSTPEAAAAALGFGTAALTILLALLRRFNVLAQADIDFAVNAIRSAKSEAADMKKTVSDITDNTRLNIVQVNKIAAAVAGESAPEQSGDTNRKKALRAFRKVRKGFFGI